MTSGGNILAFVMWMYVVLRQVDEVLRQVDEVLRQVDEVLFQIDEVLLQVDEVLRQIDEVLFQVDEVLLQVIQKSKNYCTRTVPRTSSVCDISPIMVSSRRSVSISSIVKLVPWIKGGSQSESNSAPLK
jgi:DNA integrity scanning protein DisA with diadenylate cyclase activity